MTKGIPRQGVGDPSDATDTAPSRGFASVVRSMMGGGESFLNRSCVAGTDVNQVPTWP